MFLPSGAVKQQQFPLAPRRAGAGITLGPDFFQIPEPPPFPFPAPEPRQLPAWRHPPGPPGLGGYARKRIDQERAVVDSL
jgi:hypothetical protein